MLPTSNCFRENLAAIATNLLTIFHGLGSRPVRGFRRPRTSLFKCPGEAIASILGFLTVAQPEWNNNPLCSTALRGDRIIFFFFFKFEVYMQPLGL